MKKVSEELRWRVQNAYGQDRTICVEKDKVKQTMGSDPRWLDDLGISLDDLKKLERAGLAIRARYATQNKTRPWLTGPHRVRWIILTDALMKYNTTTSGAEIKKEEECKSGVSAVENSKTSNA